MQGQRESVTSRDNVLSPRLQNSGLNVLQKQQPREGKSSNPLKVFRCPNAVGPLQMVKIWLEVCRGRPILH